MSTVKSSAKPVSLNIEDDLAYLTSVLQTTQIPPATSTLAKTTSTSPPSAPSLPAPSSSDSGASLLSISEVQETPSSIDDELELDFNNQSVMEILKRLENAEGVAGDVEGRLDAMLGSLDKLLGSLGLQGVDEDDELRSEVDRGAT